VTLFSGRDDRAGRRSRQGWEYCLARCVVLMCLDDADQDRFW
jgi:hypothetical protein